MSFAWHTWGTSALTRTFVSHEITRALAKTDAESNGAFQQIKTEPDLVPSARSLADRDVWWGDRFLWEPMREGLNHAFLLLILYGLGSFGIGASRSGVSAAHSNNLFGKLALELRLLPLAVALVGLLLFRKWPRRGLKLGNIPVHYTVSRELLKLFGDYAEDLRRRSLPAGVTKYRDLRRVEQALETVGEGIDELIISLESELAAGRREQAGVDRDALASAMEIVCSLAIRCSSRHGKVSRHTDNSFRRSAEEKISVPAVGTGTLAPASDGATVSAFDQALALLDAVGR